MDSFKGQVTDSVKAENNIHVSFVPSNTVDLLQPLDVSVSKPAKNFLCQKFDDWCASEILNNLIIQMIVGFNWFICAYR